MDFEDLPTKKSSAIDIVEKEDLSAMSLDQLEERVTRLAADIDRTKAEIAAKKASRDAAEAFFKS